MFSNDPQEVGLKPTFEDDLKEALGGELQSDVSGDLTADENVGERMLGSRLFETYVPFRIGISGPVVGVLEVYQDYTVIQAEIDRLTRTLSISLAIGLLALYVVLLPLMIGDHQNADRDKTIGSRTKRTSSPTCWSASRTPSPSSVSWTV